MFVDKAEGLRLRPGKVVAKNLNSSFQVTVDGATYFQVWSLNALDYAPGKSSGILTTPVSCKVVIDGFGRATLVP